MTEFVPVVITTREGNEIDIEVAFHWVNRKGYKSFEPTKDVNFILGQFPKWEKLADTIPF